MQKFYKLPFSDSMNHLMFFNIFFRKSFSAEQLKGLFKRLSEDPDAVEALLRDTSATTTPRNNSTPQIDAATVPAYDRKNIISSRSLFRPSIGGNSSTPPVSANSLFSQQRFTKRKTCSKEQYPDFTRKIILVDNHCCKVPDAKQLKAYRESKRICDTIVFKKKIK